MRVSPKVALLNSDDHLIDVAIIPSLTLPTACLLNGALGNDVDYMGDSFLTFAPELVISRAFESGVRLSGNIGYRFRPEAATLDLVVGNEVF